MTIRTQITTTLGAACLLMLPLSACSNSSPEAGRPDASPPTSPAITTAPEPMTAPTDPQTVTPPSRPPAANGTSLAAAEAFITHYVSLLNYSYTTGDSGPFLAASDKECIACRDLAGYVQKVNARNGGLRGDYTDSVTSVKEVFRGESGRVGGSAVLKSGEFEERSGPSASPVRKKSATGNMEFTLSVSGGSWVMFEMEIS